MRKMYAFHWSDAQYMNPSRATIPHIRPHQCDSGGGRIRGVLLYTLPIIIRLIHVYRKKNTLKKNQWDHCLFQSFRVFQWIESRKAVLGSNTLTLLQDLCEQRCGSGANSVGLMIRVLKKMGRDDVLGMLRQRKHLQGQ